MFSRPKATILVGVELGTSKICCVVAERSPEGALSIIGLGQRSSKGVRKGEVINPAQAAEDARHAIAQAEEMANVDIHKVRLGVTGSHIRGYNNRGIHIIPSVGRGVEANDVQEVLRNARNAVAPAGTDVLHSMRQQFFLDGRGPIPPLPDPVNLQGTRLEADMHVIRGDIHRLRTGIGVIEALQLEVEEVVFNGLASALAVLDHDQKELGVLVLDLGAGTADYVVYAAGAIRYSGVLAVGGDHVSNDLAHGLKITMRRAEQLKIEHGTAMDDDALAEATLTLPNEYGLPPKIINLAHLRRIMAVRLEETLGILAEELRAANLTEQLRAGVVLCGGGARIPRVADLTERVFRLPVAVGRTLAISGLSDTLDQPEFATAIGLIKYETSRSRARVRKSGLWSALDSLVGSAKSLFL